MIFYHLRKKLYLTVIQKLKTMLTVLKNKKTRKVGALSETKLLSTTAMMMMMMMMMMLKMMMTMMKVMKMEMKIMMTMTMKKMTTKTTLKILHYPSRHLLPARNCSNCAKKTIFVPHLS